MSFDTKRAEVVDCLAGIAAVRAYPVRPNSPRPGDAWTRWAGAETDSVSGQLIHTWRVVVQLPADEVTADAWLAANLMDIWAALRPAGYVDAAEPTNLGSSDDQPVYGLAYTMRSE